MNAQVLTTRTSASSAREVISMPRCNTLPSMISASTRFFAQPRLIMPTFAGAVVSTLMGFGAGELSPLRLAGETAWGAAVAAISLGKDWALEFEQRLADAPVRRGG